MLGSKATIVSRCIEKAVTCCAAAAVLSWAGIAVARVQVMGPYQHELQLTNLNSHGGRVKTLVVDLREVYACSGDANYKQTRLSSNAWYVEIIPFSDPGAVCSDPHAIKVGSLVDAAGSDPQQPLQIWINDLRPVVAVKEVLALDSQGNDVQGLSQTDELKPFGLVRLYDYGSYEFSVAIEGTKGAGTAVPGSKAKLFKLDFSYGGGDSYETENRLILAGGGSQVRIEAGDLGDFRNISLFVELTGGKAKDLSVIVRD